MIIDTYLESSDLLTKQARAFESQVLQVEFKSLFDTQELLNEMNDSNPMFRIDYAEKMYQSLLHEQYCVQLSQAGGIGIAPMIEKEIRVKKQKQGA